AWLAALLLIGCSPAKAPPAPEQSAPAAKAPTAVPADPVPTAPVPTNQHAPQLFGAPIDEQAPEVALAALIAKPEPYAGKVVRTQGTVSRVCQAAGCWMELRDDSSGQSVRTPMAGHAFFLPKDAMGKHAAVQGIVELRPLTAGHKQHLEAEGATATDSLLSISATGVALR
ncbi:MAG TPA: DUF4920 domain-containing protein, partial [Polyangiales bacterium]|nr:DUF4920 domain-containing protein [Polyangiales bacterium]